MKNTIFFIFLAACGFTANSQNGAYMEYSISTSSGFNGNVKVNYSDLGTGTEFNMVIPQMPGGGFSNRSLMQKEKPGIIYIIDDKNKSITETKQTDNSGDNKTYVVKKLGDEKVGAYKCVHAMITEGTDSHEVWYTKDFPDYAKYAQALNSNSNVGSQKREKALKDAGCEGVPVKTIHTSAAQGSMTMELVKLEKKTFKKSDFDLPAGYNMAGVSSAGSGTAEPGGVKMKTQQK